MQTLDNQPLGPGAILRTSADVSSDGRYRYTLSRTWDTTRPTVLWVMANPSTADASADDPTIRRCCGYARRWGFGGIRVVNLLAIRATDPADVRAWARLGSDVVGRGNVDAVRRALGAVKADGLVVAAWGAVGSTLRAALPQALQTELDLVIGMVRGQPGAVALALTQGGEPAHPLYKANDLVPVYLATGEPAEDRAWGRDHDPRQLPLLGSV